MNHWCESCARKNLCYVVDARPKCFVPITSNDRTADRKTEPQNDLLVTEYPQDGEVNLIGRDKTEAVVMAYDTYKELTEPQTDCSWK